MTTITTGPHLAREATNPFERVLWILAGVLLIGSVAAVVTAHNIFTSHSSGWSSPQPTDIYIAQLLSSFGPSGFTGGIFLAGLALTTRVLRFDRRAEAAHALAGTTAEPARESHPAALFPVAGDRRIAPAPVDHSVYMRPRSTD